MIDKFDRIKLGHFPTPIEYLNNITEHLNGPQIYIKRDDCTGLATGGNKTRKLEFLMPDAIKNQADLVVTVCLLYTSPSPRDGLLSRMPSSA